MTDGTAAFNRTYRGNLCFDLTKNAAHRVAFGLAAELKKYGGTAVSLTPVSCGPRRCWTTSG